MNIHVLPTDKPSRLWTNNLRRRLELDEFPESHPTNIAKHLYITSDEEIKEGDKSLLFVEGFKPMILTHFEPVEEGYEGKKIILTTDQDLIKDGIQAIDDEFLEWFVKNPSCEEVNIEITRERNGYSSKHKKRYKIIIPKEEPILFESFDKEKSEVITKIGQKLVRELQSVVKEEPKQKTLNLDKLESKLDDALAKETKESLSNWLNSKRNKQETLEEAAERYEKFRVAHDENYIVSDDIQDLKESYYYKGRRDECIKWQAERMYSEDRKTLLDIELVNPLHLTMIKSGYGEFPDTYKLTQKGVDYIIEQFKKK